MKEQSSSFRSRTTVFLAAVCFACAAGLFSPMTHGATITVTSLADSGPGTLREAINTANGNGEDDTIEFSVTGTITLASQLPTITTAIDISGPGADLLTIDGGNSVRILELFGSSALSNISNLRFANGYANGDLGGAIKADAGFSGPSLAVQFCTFDGNHADDNGGAIFALQNIALHVFNCYFVNNSSDGSGGAVDANGGEIVIIAESLFEENEAAGGGGAVSFAPGADIASSTFTGNDSGGTGGAINFATGLSNIVTNCTIVDNTANVGGAIHGGSPFSSVELSNNILHNNSATTSSPNISGDITSFGGNIIGDTSGWTNGPHASDLVGVDPLLGPLANNGGPTRTFLPHPLLSPAIDAGENSRVDAFAEFLAHPFDQRLEARVFNSTVDIGAVEVQPGDPVPAPVSGTVAMIITTLFLTLCAGLVLATKGQRTPRRRKS